MPASRNDGPAAPPRDPPSIQARTYESIGRLASGISHEINTPIQYLGTNLGFLQTAFRDLLTLQEKYREVIACARAAAALPTATGEALDELETRLEPDYLEREIPACLTQTQEGLERVTQIVLALKDFSHPSLHTFATTDLNRNLKTMVQVTIHKWKKVADLQFDLDPSLPPVICSSGEINQVILNLLVNASQAVSAKVDAGGYIRGLITVGSRSEGDHVRFTVTDDGPGIAPAHCDLIFTPQFTTKSPGEGTGQGLVLAREIVVQRHHGDITFATEPGKGTTFTVRLPLRQDGNRPEGDRETTS